MADKGIVEPPGQWENERRHLSLCEALDRILNKGAVVAADITISVADIELIYISLQALVSSVETARCIREELCHEKSQ